MGGNRLNWVTFGRKWRIQCIWKGNETQPTHHRKLWGPVTHNPTYETHIMETFLLVSCPMWLLLLWKRICHFEFISFISDILYFTGNMLLWKVDRIWKNVWTFKRRISYIRFLHGRLPYPFHTKGFFFFGGGVWQIYLNWLITHWLMYQSIPNVTYPPPPQTTSGSNPKLLL